MNELKITTRYNAVINAEGQIEVSDSAYRYQIGELEHPVQRLMRCLNKRVENDDFETWLRLIQIDCESTTTSTVMFSVLGDGNYYFVGCDGSSNMYAISESLATTRQVVATPSVASLLIATSLVAIAGFIQLPVFDVKALSDTVIKLPITEIDDRLSYANGLLYCQHNTETDEGIQSHRYHLYTKIRDGVTDCVICVNGNQTMMIPNPSTNFDFV